MKGNEWMRENGEGGVGIRSWSRTRTVSIPGYTKSLNSPFHSMFSHIYTHPPFFESISSNSPILSRPWRAFGRGERKNGLFWDSLRALATKNYSTEIFFGSLNVLSAKCKYSVVGDPGRLDVSEPLLRNLSATARFSKSRYIHSSWSSRQHDFFRWELRYTFERFVPQRRHPHPIFILTK